MDFYRYSEVLFSAYRKQTRIPDILRKKQEIQSTVYEIHNVQPTTILFIGFTPMMLTDYHKEISVAGVSDEIVKYLESMGKRVNVVDLSSCAAKHFDCVVALDEYFTFALSDDEQYHLVEECCRLSKGLIITTLRDHKNQDFKSREFSLPTALVNSKETTIYLEYNDYSARLKNAWTSRIYELGSNMVCHSDFQRRPMFFKQLAKFTKDFGALDFMIHKNVMYKSMIRKNYEHVISVNFQ